MAVSVLSDAAMIERADVVEDSPITAADLIAEGIPQAVVDCVILLTRRDDVPEADYSDAARLAQIPEPKQTELRAKYRRAYLALGEPEMAAALGQKSPA